MDIKTGCELKYENLVSLRVKGTQVEINNAVKELDGYLKDNSLNKAGPFISVTYTAEQTSGQVILDMEVLIPVDKPVLSSGNYKFKPEFRLVNAAYIKHEGRPEQLQNTCNQLIAYLRESSLQNITPLYNVMVKEPEVISGAVSNMTVDIYIGLNPNIL